MNEFTEQFLVEGRELVEEATAALLKLEGRPSDGQALEKAFRTFHTLKGSAGIMEYIAMEQLLHKAEDTLQDLRSGARRAEPALIDALLACLGQLVRWFQVIEKTDAMPADAEADAARLGAGFGAQPVAKSAPVASPPQGEAPHALRQILEEQIRFLRLFASGGRLESAGRSAANALKASGLDASAVEAAAGDADTLMAAITAALGAGSVLAAQPAVDEGVATTIRVDVGQLDALVSLVGELMVVKNAIGHWSRRAADQVDGRELSAGLQAEHERLTRHVSELQRTVFDLRVLPMSRVFGRFPRLVRDTAARLGKQVSLRTEGGDTKADKAVIEALFEPLLHVVRNAIDHGIEPPDVRTRAGKPAQAEIVMRAWREGEHVVVEVADDGRGVDPAAIRKAAVERGVASADTVTAMDDAQAASLIFAAGFSTAEAVSDLSGRGVGMGAVRAAIQRIGGDVSLLNRPGQGLTVRLELPFTVMLTRIMTVSAGGQTFGLPFDAILETVRIPRRQIRLLGAGRAFVLRDQTIPVINLAESLGLRAGEAAGDACIMVVWTGGASAGLEIEKPGERLDLMLKPVEGILAGMKAVAGTSLLGDGQVLIVLDLQALLE